MQHYKDLNNDSGILAYESGDDYIKVQFKDGAIYLYNYNKPGSQHIEEMKRLANNGNGLNSYIGKYVKSNYAFRMI